MAILEEPPVLTSSPMGTVHQINTSKGGVPKLPVEHAVIGDRGVIGDEQADKVHHGHPDQALCLFSLEVIERFRSEGHPIDPGSAGENVTVSGIDWGEVVPGRRMTIGPVEIEITHYATPCSKNARWFAEGRYNRMHESLHPGESRVYARVLAGGAIRSGDTVALVD
jgi:MOSC domain-containing protein YiiM